MIPKSNPDNTVLFCVIKNDLQRLQQFLPYYRNIGVTSFVFTDNASTDGTYEYLKEQEDVILYSESTTYSSRNRVMWLDKMLNLHGKDKWCIVVDSDEFISYIGFESHNIHELIDVAVSNGYGAITGFMVEMYSESPMFSLKHFDIDSKQYFDRSGYIVSIGPHGLEVHGGPRTRLFHTGNHLAKYPVFYYCDGVHYRAAHYLNMSDTYELSPIWIALRHFKFQTEFDLEKLKDAVADKVYYAKSRHYAPIYDYIQKRCIPTMYNYDVSRLYRNSKSLKCINILEDPFDIRYVDRSDKSFVFIDCAKMDENN